MTILIHPTKLNRPHLLGFSLAIVLLLAAPGFSAAQSLDGLKETLKDTVGQNEQATTDNAPAIADTSGVDPRLISNLRNEISELQTSVQDKIRQITALNDRISAMGEEMELLKGQNDQLSAQIGEKDAALNQAQDENNGLTEQLSALGGDLSEKEAAVEDLQGEKSFLSEMIDKGKDQLAGLQDQLGKATAQLSEVTAELSEKVKESELLQGKVDSLNKDLEGSESEKGGLLAQISELSGNLKSRAEKLVNFETELAQLQDLADSRQGEIEQLTKTLKSAQTELTGSLARNDELTEEVRKLTQGVSLSKAESKTAQQKLARLEGDVTALKGQLAEQNSFSQGQTDAIEELQMHRLALGIVAALCLAVALLMAFTRRRA